MQIPKQLQNPDFRFIKVNGKVPVEKDWNITNNYAYNDSRLTEWQGNIGVATGFGNLVVVDFDSQKAVELYKDKLPPTFEVVTANKKLPHMYYITDGQAKTFHGKSQGIDVDIQAQKAQVICAGSTLTDTYGNVSSYKIVNDIEISHITNAELAIIFGLGKETPKEEKFKDESRSGQEWGKICQEVRKGLKDPYGLDKDKIFKVMELYSKWKDGTDAYRERTFARAVEHVNKQIEESKTVKSSELTINNYVQNVENFWISQPFFYDKNGLFWLWDLNNSKYIMTDEVDIMDLIDKELSLNGQTISGKVKMSYVDAFKRVGRRHIPKDPKYTWVQFKNVIVDIEDMSRFPATPDYLFASPIPWEIGESDETPLIDKLFVDWVGEEEKISLYEIISYCCLNDYPIHRIFVMLGPGGNGKSSFQTLLSKFIGDENITSTELDYLTGGNRFESAKLYKKKVCLMGETNAGTIQKTSKLKQLSGKDKIGIEIKNKNPFDFINTAKIIINSNHLPTSTDSSDGFHRRWFILKFPNTFKDGKDITRDVPDIEFKNFAFKSIKILYDLIKRGKFLRDGTLEERKIKYIEASNPLSLYIKEHCILSDQSKMGYNELYTKYIKYLAEKKLRIVSKKEFSEVLSTEGLSTFRTSEKVDNNYRTINYIIGIELKTDPKIEQSVLDEFAY